MKSRNITVTDGRLLDAWGKITEVTSKNHDNAVSKKIEEASEEAKIKTGRLICFYPYLDKCKVVLKDETVICKVLHRLGGGLIDFYTPIGERDFDEKLKEPCITPLEQSHCLVADIREEDSREMLLLGFYQKEDLRVTPAESGHYKIMGIGVANEYGLDFSNEEFKVFTHDGASYEQGFHEDTESTSIDFDRPYFTKEEVEDLLINLKQEIEENYVQKQNTT